MPFAIKHVSATVSATTTLYTCPAGRTAKVTLSSVSATNNSTAGNTTHTLTAGGVLTLNITVAPSSTVSSGASSISSGSGTLSVLKTTPLVDYLGPGQTYVFTAGANLSSATVNLSIVEEVAL